MEIETCTEQRLMDLSSGACIANNVTLLKILSSRREKRARSIPLGCTRRVFTSSWESVQEFASHCRKTSREEGARIRGISSPICTYLVMFERHIAGCCDMVRACMCEC
jgi:hypothetical protein